MGRSEVANPRLGDGHAPEFNQQYNPQEDMEAHMITRFDMMVLMDKVFSEEINALREDGQKEYARGDENTSAFANFERVAADLDIPREKVLWVYAMKHKDGIASHLNGHTSQREDVRGRINDLIVYLFLLRGMLDEGSS